MAATFEYTGHRAVIIHYGDGRHNRFLISSMIEWCKTGKIHSIYAACDDQCIPLPPANVEEKLLEVLFNPCSCGIVSDDLEQCETMGIRTHSHSNWIECLALQVLRFGMTNKQRVNTNALLLATLGYPKFLTYVLQDTTMETEKILKVLYEDSTYSYKYQGEISIATLIAARAVLDISRRGSQTKAAVHESP